MQSYYTYHGSLTTPQCQEAVTWIVMDKPIIISDTQVRKIIKKITHKKNSYKNKYTKYGIGKTSVCRLHLFIFLNQKKGDDLTAEYIFRLSV